MLFPHASHFIILILMVCCVFCLTRSTGFPFSPDGALIIYSHAFPLFFVYVSWFHVEGSVSLIFGSIPIHMIPIITTLLICAADTVLDVKLLLIVCNLLYVCVVITYSKSMDQPGKVANPARGQLVREN